MSPILRSALPPVALATVWLLLACAPAAPAEAAAAESWPMPEWSRAAPPEVGMDAALLEKARDEYAYIYSFDSDSAYVAADRMVLARVPFAQITEQSAYEFFVRMGGDGRPEWTADITRRGPVFEHKGRCYRSGISYNAGLKRYLWWQVIPGGAGAIQGRLRCLRCPGTVGAMDHRVLHRAVGRGAGRVGLFPDQVDEPRWPDGAPGLLRR